VLLMKQAMFIIKLYFNAIKYFDESVRIFFRRFFPMIASSGLYHLVSGVLVGLYFITLMSIVPVPNIAPVNQAVDPDVISNKQDITSTPVSDAQSNVIIDYTTGTAVLVDGSIQVLSSPEVNSEIILQLTIGDEFKFDGLKNDYWWFIDTKNGSGWINSRLITIEAENDTETPDVRDTAVVVEIVTAEITAERLNMRSGPGVEYSIIMKLNRADVVTLTGVSENDWVQVEYARTTGWVNSNYINIKRN
jgi:uncharacterized protein YraI